MQTKFCHKCGIAKPVEEFTPHKNRPDGLQVYCRACMAVYRHSHYQRNKSAYRERGRKWLERHPDKSREYSARWREKNPEKARAVVHRFEKSEKGREARQRYDHSEKGKEKQRRYGKTENGQEKRRIWSHTHIRERRSLRRAREQNVVGIHTVEDIRRQFDAQQGLCWWCSQKLETQFHVDHVIPIARGGSNWPSNIVCACSFCNRSKGGKLAYDEWQPPNPLKPRTGNTESQL